MGGPPNTRQCFCYDGGGITVSDGPTWSHARKTLRPVFQISQFTDLEKNTFEKHFQMMLKRIPQDGSAIDLQELLERLVSRSHFLRCIKNAKTVSSLSRYLWNTFSEKHDFQMKSSTRTMDTFL